MLFQVRPQLLQVTDVSGAGVFSPASISTSGQAPMSNHSPETAHSHHDDTAHQCWRETLTGSVFVKQSCPHGQAQLLPTRGLPTCLCLAGSQGWGPAPRLLFHHVPEPGLWLSTDHRRPSSTPMGEHGHSTTMPSRFASSSVLSSFLISSSFFLLEGMCHPSSQPVPLAFCYLITVLITYLPG